MIYELGNKRNASLGHIEQPRNTLCSPAFAGVCYWKLLYTGYRGKHIRLNKYCTQREREGLGAEGETLWCREDGNVCRVFVGGAEHFVSRQSFCRGTGKHTSPPPASFVVSIQYYSPLLVLLSTVVASHSGRRLWDVSYEQSRWCTGAKVRERDTAHITPGHFIRNRSFTKFTIRKVWIFSQREVNVLLFYSGHFSNITKSKSIYISATTGFI